MRLFLPTILLLLAGPGLDGAEPLKPIHLDGVNTEADEDDPHLSPDGSQLFFASNPKGKFDILVSIRRTSDRLYKKWPAGQLVNGYLQSKADDRSVFLTPREDRGRGPQYLYFATKKDDKPEASFDLFVSMKLNAKSDFGDPLAILPVCTEADELHPWLSADGRQLYFSRKTEEGWRVFISSRPKPTGPSGFGKPTMVKLPMGFHHPTLTPDGRTMYLQGPVGKDRWGLFRTSRIPDGWKEPEPLIGLNQTESKVGDKSPSLSRDGNFLFFASDRPGGAGGLDLWVINTTELSRRK